MHLVRTFAILAAAASAACTTVIDNSRQNLTNSAVSVVRRTDGQTDIRYGAFCGAQNPANYDKSDRSLIAAYSQTMPADEIDLACKVHDICLIYYYERDDLDYGACDALAFDFFHARTSEGRVGIATFKDTVTDASVSDRCGNLAEAISGTLACKAAYPGLAGTVAPSARHPQSASALQQWNSFSKPYCQVEIANALITLGFTANSGALPARPYCFAADRRQPQVDLIGQRTSLSNLFEPAFLQMVTEIVRRDKARLASGR